MSIIKKLAGQTAVYGLSTILGRLLNFWLVPFHTSIFPSSEFGIITELYAYIALLNVIFTFGMETAYFRFATKHESDFLKAFNNSFSAVLLFSGIVSGVIFLFSSQIATLLSYPDKAELIRWVALILASDAIVSIPFARIRLLNKIYLFAGARFFSIVINIFLNIFFLLLCPLIMNDRGFPELKPVIATFYNPQHGVAYVFIANFISNLIYFPFLIPAFRGLKLNIDPVYLKRMISYAFPILVMGIAGTINDMFSRIMLKALLPVNFYPGKSNEAVLGIFGACYKLSVFMVLAIQAFRYASEPFFFSNAKDKNAPGLFAKVMSYFVLVCMVIFLAVSVNLSWISDIFLKRPEYKEALDIVPILLMANLFIGVYFNLSVWYKLTDKTYWGTYIALTGAALTVTFNFLLIPHFGYMGSVWATFICYLGMVIMSYVLGQKFYPIPYNVFKILAYIVIGVSVYIISLNLEFYFKSDLVIQNLLVLAYIILLILLEKSGKTIVT